MPVPWRRRAPWLLVGLLCAIGGAAIIVRVDIAQRRERFQADAAVVHRLLGERAAQHDAILATLVLLDEGSAASSSPDSAAHPDRPELRLPALYPQVLAVLRRGPGQAWPEPALDAAEARSRALPARARHPVLGPVDAATGRYTLVLAGDPASYALRLDLHELTRAGEWPLQRNGPVRALLLHEGRTLLLDPGPEPAALPAGLTAGFTFSRTLSTPSQPFELRLQRVTGPAQWPWRWLLAWVVLSAAGVSAAAAAWRVRQERRRAAELMRLSQVGRLGTLGELAGGVAHELNQPLTAVLAGTQTALRVLREPPAAIDEQSLATAREALTLAGAQARRAADVVARLRRLVQPAQPGAVCQPVRAGELVDGLLELLEPELRRRGVRAQRVGELPPLWADPVALEQIVHNLVGNAMQAVESRPAGERSITVELALDGVDGVDAAGAAEAGAPATRGLLRVSDTGPGIPDDVLPRLFEPFFTTRSGGLGLGLPLCETLAQAMGGTIVARNTARGAQFELALPLARADALAPRPASREHAA